MTETRGLPVAATTISNKVSEWAKRGIFVLKFLFIGKSDENGAQLLKFVLASKVAESDQSDKKATHFQSFRCDMDRIKTETG